MSPKGERIALVPSRRALVLLGAATPLFLLSAPIGLMVDAVILLLMLVDGSKIRAPLVTRSPPRISALATVSDVQVTLTNREKRPVVVMVTDDLDPCLRRVKTPESLGEEGGLRVELDAEGAARWDYQVVPRTRGFLDLGDIHLRTRSPWGLAWHRSRVGIRHVLQVQPGIADLLKDKSVHALRRLRDPGLRRARLLGEGREFESLRDYAPGDDPRTIDWKASAKRTGLVVRTYEAERHQSIVLAIDAGRHMRERLSPVRERIDYALGACMMLAGRAQSFGDRIGTMVFDSSVRHISPARRADPSALAKVLAGVETRLVEPNYPLAFTTLARTFRRRSLVVLFCDVIDAAVSRALVDSFTRIGRAHLPLAIAIRNPALEAIAVRPVEDAASAYERAAAEELLQARTRTLGLMKRAGIIVVDTPPGEALIRTLDKYLEIKERGQL